MKILCIGDIVGSTGRRMLNENLNQLVQHESIDFVVANAENSAHGRGFSRKNYDELKNLGIDAFTLGNHTWNCNDITSLLSYNDNIVRPANFDSSCPGKGSAIVKAKNGVNIGIINIIGRVYMDPNNSPFDAVINEINSLKNKCKIILVDFHAEATSEKIAMGWFLDGKVSAVFGTHTHVQTSDLTILSHKTGYITDLGMTGPKYSVLGMERKNVIDKFINGMPHRFEVANGKGILNGCIFDIDDTGNTQKVKLISINED